MTTFLILLVLAIAGVLGFSYFAYRIAFYSPVKGRTEPAGLKGAQYDPYQEVMGIIYHQLADRPCEEVTILSRDNLKLYGRYYHVKDGAPLDIGFHGYRSCCLRDFSGGSEISFGREHNLLLVDQRAHGKSEGSSITFGIQERYDCLDWINYAVDRFGKDVKIMLYGISMGASTVLMASALDLPKNVKGIIADCPYSAPKKIIQKVCTEMRVSPALCYPFVAIGAKIFGSFDLEETDALEAVKHSKVPILILHGEADSFVPCEMSEEIQNACPDNVERHTFPDADHGISYLVDKDRYCKIVDDFLDNVLK